MSENSRRRAGRASTRLVGVLAIGLIAFSLLAMHAFRVGHGMPTTAEHTSHNVATVTDRAAMLGIAHDVIDSITPTWSASDMCVAVLAGAVSLAALALVLGAHSRQVGPKAFPSLMRAAVAWRAEPPPPRSALSLRC